MVTKTWTYEELAKGEGLDADGMLRLTGHNILPAGTLPPSVKGIIGYSASTSIAVEGRYTCNPKKNANTSLVDGKLTRFKNSLVSAARCAVIFSKGSRSLKR
jgi:hypothetical protein